MRHLSWSLLVLTLASAGEALAIPLPLPEDQLLEMADAAVEGLVISQSYLGKGRQGDYEVERYRSELQVEKSLKGKLLAGAVLVVLWETEHWVGKGEQPEGRAPSPTYPVCARVRAYLGAGREKHTHSTVEWNGRKWLAMPPSDAKWPNEKQKTLRCVKGRIS